MIALKWDNRIFSNVKAAVFDKTKCRNVVRHANFEDTVFPTVLIELLTTKGYSENLENEDCGAKVTYQIQCYSAGRYAFSEAKEIIEVVFDEMKRMGFQMSSIRQLQTPTGQFEGKVDPQIFRYIVRFTRPIMSGDEISKYEN